MHVQHASIFGIRRGFFSLPVFLSFFLSFFFFFSLSYSPLITNDRPIGQVGRIDGASLDDILIIHAVRRYLHLK